MAEYTEAAAPATSGPTVKYGVLKQEHPEYKRRLPYWQELRALYAGGEDLLRNHDVLARLFERQGNESVESWQKRMARAFYVNHFGTVIDDIVAQLTDPLEMLEPGATVDSKQKTPKEWEAFFEDCSPPAGETTSFSDLMLEQTRTALVVGCMWSLVDMPPAPEVQPSSLREQDEAGLRDTWVCGVAPECVLNWELVGDGEFLWVKTCFTSRHQPSPFSAQVLIREEYTVYTAETWTRFVVEYDENQERQVGPGEPAVKKKPKDTDEIPGVVGFHSFKRVPLVRKVLPPGLWAGNKLHSLAVEYFNRSNADAHGQKNIVCAQLYEFLGPEYPGVDEEVKPEAQQDPNRARRQPRGPDIVQVRGNQDKAEYISPPAEGFERVAKSLDELESEMYRVAYSMVNTTNDAPALGRSAESKAIDSNVTRRAANLVADETKDHAVEVVNMAAVGRGDMGNYGEATWKAQGMEAREEEDAGTLIDQNVSLEAISVESATFQRVRKLGLAKAYLGKAATPEVVKAIEKELGQAITQDQLMGMAAVASGVGADGKPIPVPGADEDDDGGFPAKKSGAAGKGKAPQKKKPMKAKAG